MRCPSTAITTAYSVYVVYLHHMAARASRGLDFARSIKSAGKPYTRYLGTLGISQFEAKDHGERAQLASSLALQYCNLVGQRAHPQNI